MTRVVLVCIVTLVFLVGGLTCGTGTPLPSGFSAFPNPIEFLVPGEEIYLTIEANEGSLASWSVSAVASWILMEPTSGTGNGRVKVHIDRESMAPGEYSEPIQVVTNLGTTTVTVMTTIHQGTGLTGEIAFASHRDGNWDIYAMNVNDKSVRRLTDSTADDIAPFYAPDGNTIVFASNRSGNYDIYTMSVDTGGGTPLIVDSADDRYPSVSPDGTKIAFIRREGEEEERILYVANINGGSITRMKNDQMLRYTYSTTAWPMDEVHLGDSRPAWSPDGSKIYVSYWVIPGPTPTQRARNIAEFRATDPNADLRGIGLNSGVGGDWDTWSDVSPDGTKIAGGADPRIFVVDLDGAVVDPILPADSDNDSAPTWSPDGQHIAYGSNETGLNRDIWVVDTFMTRGQYLRVQLTDDAADDETPVWRPQ
ncbi:MAG: PD40 domain-containing protein [Phycisphaerae bacterium]|nr:PD40 domain-containing protein [Phycisphaerae bacterium]